MKVVDTQPEHVYDESVSCEGATDKEQNMMTREEYENVRKILDRACAFSPFFAKDRIGLMMDLEFCNENVPLDFEKLLSFAHFDFMHDLSGIYSNFDRGSKTLKNCFLPRCAKPVYKQIVKPLEGIEVKGHVGTWYEIDRRVYNGEVLYLMENEQEGDELPCLIINTNKEEVLCDVYNGWLDYEESLDQ